MKGWISKKLLVYVGSVIVLILVKAGVPEETAGPLIDKIVELAIWYLGAQGAVDTAKEIGKGIAIKNGGAK